MAGFLEAAQISKCGIYINQLNHGFRSGACLRNARSVHDEGDLGSDVEKCHFPPEEVIPEMIAVVRGENYNGIFCETLFFKRLENDSDLSIDKGNASMIGLHVFPS